MNFSNKSPSYRLQFFFNYSIMGPFYGVQACRNRLLQCGSCAKSQVLSANLFQLGLLFPLVHSSFQKPGPAQASHQIRAFFRHPPALVWGPPWAVRGHSASPWSAPGAAGNVCSSTRITSLLLHWPWCLQNSLSHILTLLSSGCNCCCSGFSLLISEAWPWPAVGLSWNWLVLALLNIEETSSSFLKESPP